MQSCRAVTDKTFMSHCFGPDHLRLLRTLAIAARRSRIIEAAAAASSARSISLLSTTPMWRQLAPGPLPPGLQLHRFITLCRKAPAAALTSSKLVAEHKACDGHHKNQHAAGTCTQLQLPRADFPCHEMSNAKNDHQHSLTGHHSQ